MRTMKAENGGALAKNEAAINRLQASNEKAIGELRAAIFVQIISVAALVVAAVGVIIGYNRY